MLEGIYEMGETAFSTLVGGKCYLVKIGHSLLGGICFSGILISFL
jgi:hypothetical protein